MSTAVDRRPSPGEYAPYYDKYISRVVPGDIVAALGAQLETTLTQLRGIPESKAGFRYAPEKWSIRELLGHVIDTERIFAYRALRFARCDKSPLAGFDQDSYVAEAGFESCSLAELITEFEQVRGSTILLFRHLAGEAWPRTGTANDAEVSVRALAYIIAGHELHHMEVLRAKYLA